MRLNFALVSTFLLASAALAEFHREKQLPASPNRVEAPINSTSDSSVPLTYKNTWAGAVYLRNKRTFVSATGTFIVPNARGEVGSGFIIAVGIDGITCTSPILAAGIRVDIDNNGVSFRAVGGMWPNDILDHPDPSVFEISAGDKIKVNVHVDSPVKVSFTIINSSTGKSWADALKVKGSLLCQKNAEFVVTTLPDSDAPLACFDPVTFTDLLLGPDRGDSTIDVNIQKDNQDVTSVLVQDGSITVTYRG